MRSLPRFEVGAYVGVKAPFLIPGLTKPGTGNIEGCGYVENVTPSLDPREGITYWVRLVGTKQDGKRPILPCKEHELTLFMGAKPAPESLKPEPVDPELAAIEPGRLSYLQREREEHETLKDTAQRLLNQFTQPAPGQRYEHYKGGKYEVVAVSLDESTLEPLVTYRSLKQGTTWTRTRKNFTEGVKQDKSGCVVGRPRFMRTYDEPAPKPRGRFAVVNLKQMPLKFTYWHTSYSEASKEAERLASLNPDTPFSVMSEFATATAKVAPVTWESKGAPLLPSEEQEHEVDPFSVSDEDFFSDPDANPFDE